MNSYQKLVALHETTVASVKSQSAKTVLNSWLAARKKLIDKPFWGSLEHSEVPIGAFRNALVAEWKAPEVTCTYSDTDVMQYYSQWILGEILEIEILLVFQVVAPYLHTHTEMRVSVFYEWRDETWIRSAIAPALQKKS